MRAILRVVVAAGALSAAGCGLGGETVGILVSSTAPIAAGKSEHTTITLRYPSRSGGKVRFECATPADVSALLSQADVTLDNAGNARVRVELRAAENATPGSRQVRVTATPDGGYPTGYEFSVTVR